VTFIYDNLLIIKCDREKVAQIFQNLFENAVTHGEPSKIEVKQRHSEDSTSISIVNDGKPIPLEHHSEIFLRGFTTKEGSGGLGLAIVKKTVEAHGWKIRLDTTPQTTFPIMIPNRK